MAEKTAIRRRAPTAAERERMRKAIEEESRPEAIEANRELGRKVLANKQEAAAATAAVLKTLLDEKKNASNFPWPILKPKRALVAAICPGSGISRNPV
jgi:hypothetical protein